MALSDLPTSERMKRRVVSTGDLEKLERRDEADRYTSVLVKNLIIRISPHVFRDIELYTL
jgi:hypothetical protein